jgi:hypothetical protein
MLTWQEVPFPLMYLLDLCFGHGKVRSSVTEALGFQAVMFPSAQLR